MIHKIKCHFRNMQPAEILCAISQKNAEIAKKQDDLENLKKELEQLKQWYTEKANDDIMNALKAVTHGQAPSSSSGSSKKRNKPYERRSSDDSGPSRPTSAKGSARDRNARDNQSPDRPEHKLPKLLSTIMNINDPKHFVSRINFLSYKDRSLSNERLLENENMNFVVMVRNFRYSSLDFFLQLTALRRNVMDQINQLFKTKVV